MLFINCAVTLLFAGINLSGIILAVFLFSYLAVMGFEFVNGFHDTANAVATVIYTKTLKPFAAIVWSGICNFLGVVLIGTAVAMSLLKVVPIEKLVTLPVAVGACLVIAILLGSIIWNLGTWYLGLPLSSTHTLIGAMVGASLAFTWYYGGPGVNWGQTRDIALSLLFSPIIGFFGALLLMYAEKRTLKSTKLFHIPENEEDKPPLPIRILLLTTCTLVSFFHGSNDGQKGVGLMMLVLIAFLPANFILNNKISDSEIIRSLNNTEQTLQKLTAPESKQQAAIKKLELSIDSAKGQIGNKDAKSTQQKFKFRKQIQKVTAALKAFTDNKEMKLQPQVKDSFKKDTKSLQKVTDFAPIWVILTISVSLGLGTMIGWKRIVVTIGERIGNEHLNYAQGATAEIVAAVTIGLSSGLGLPVSTTHVLSSGIAGAMAGSKGMQNLNKGTIKNIILAWVLTLPVAIILSFLLFMLLHLFV